MAKHAPASWMGRLSRRDWDLDTLTPEAEQPCWKATWLSCSPGPPQKGMRGAKLSVHPPGSQASYHTS